MQAGLAGQGGRTGARLLAHLDRLADTIGQRPGYHWIIGGEAWQALKAELPSGATSYRGRRIVVARDLVGVGLHPIAIGLPAAA